MKRAHRTLTPETLAKIRGAREATAGREPTPIRCPLCHHRITDKYDGASGYIKAKCTACGVESTIDLASWRKMKISN
jgi:DNA-directed RNA polymerase subunit RPC12/RpoP